MIAIRGAIKPTAVALNLGAGAGAGPALRAANDRSVPRHGARPGPEVPPSQFSTHHDNSWLQLEILQGMEVVPAITTKPGITGSATLVR